MSDILDNKSDAEIEEIYSRATFEDLQSMLTQEKCLNRRRLLRKVMRCKASNPLEISDSHKSGHTEKTITTEPQKNKENIESKVDHEQSDSVKVSDGLIQNQLDKLRNQLHDTVDLTKRKELRKEIQELENSCGTQPNAINNNSHNSSISISMKDNFNDEKKRTSFHITEDPKPPPKVSLSKINKENEPKFNNIKATNSNKEMLNKEHSPIQNSTNIIANDSKSDKLNSGVSNQNVSHKNLDRTDSELSIKSTSTITRQTNDNQNIQNMNITKESSPSHNEMLNKATPVHPEPRNNIQTTISEMHPQRNSPRIDSKPITRSSTVYSPSNNPIPSQIKHETSTTPIKQNISRVSSVREKFENPPIATNSIKKPVSSKMTEQEINDLVNAVLSPEKSKTASADHKLTVPNQPPRKISQTHGKTPKNSKSSLKDLLLMWIEKNTEEYQNISITNYSKSWADGLAFCALIHHFYPDSFDYHSLSSNNPVANFTLAFNTAKKYAGIEPLIEPEDMIILDSPDEKCVYTYVQFMYNALKGHPRNTVKYVTNSES